MPTSAKQIEAIRDGVEDYEYLRMLAAAVDETCAAADSPDVAAARELLRSAPQRVTEAIHDVSMLKWAAEKDRSVADQVRVQILEMLMRLSKSRSHRVGEASSIDRADRGSSGDVFAGAAHAR